MGRPVVHFEIGSKDKTKTAEFLGDPNNGFTETGDCTLAEENGKTRLNFKVKNQYFGFLPRLLEPFITPRANKNSTRTCCA
jgi:carbon monoxide dehydrogenase subunit G